ncbi:5-oxoprolinase subunit PxpA [Aquimarina addita]|uniref:5-oxoprolinase subunit PxpA n=1 Tax=Aquimarina addita TaxID=870485 RepID=A0ABP6UNA3_9FLAO
MKKILLNSDVGEEAGFDEEIMPFVSLCNIACGTHAGSEKVIRETIDLAIRYQVKIGAHPSYPDRKNFGRSVMKISSDDLEKTLTDQILCVKDWAEKAGTTLYHVKPHGALYNQTVKNKAVAKSVIRSIRNIDKSIKLISPKESIISYLSQGDIDVISEVFADRNYERDLSLVSRSEKQSVISDPEQVLEHVLQMIEHKKVKTKSGVEVPVFFDTICVHGDHLKSVEILRLLHGELLVRNMI